MVFKLGKIQIPLTGETDNFDGTMMLSKTELALTNSMIQVKKINQNKLAYILSTHKLMCHMRATYNGNGIFLFQ